MILVRNKIAEVLIPRKFRAICIWPFILLRPSVQMRDISGIIHHEKIHARQQLEMAWIFFFLWYAIEFIVRFLKLRDPMKAYKHISHEKEAFVNEDNHDYLKNRRPYAWINYL